MNDLPARIGLRATIVGLQVVLLDMAVDHRGVLFESRTKADVQRPVEPLEPIGVDRVTLPRFSEVRQFMPTRLQVEDPGPLKGISTPSSNLASPGKVDDPVLEIG